MNQNGELEQATQQRDKGSDYDDGEISDNMQDRPISRNNQNSSPQREDSLDSRSNHDSYRSYSSEIHSSKRNMNRSSAPEPSSSPSRNKPNQQQEQEQQQQQQQTIKKFDYQVFFENEQKEFVVNTFQDIVAEAQKTSPSTTIEINKEVTVPGLNGVLIEIKGDTHLEKRSALQTIFTQIQSKGLIKLDFSICMIPHQMVNFVIGQKGKQINQMMSESGTKIVVNQPIDQMKLRTIRISGDPKKLANSISLIYSTVEERVSRILEPIEDNSPHKPIDQATSARFVITSRLFDHVNRKHYLLDNIEAENHVTIDFPREPQLFNQISRNDCIFQVQGKLVDVLKALRQFSSKIQRFQEDTPSHSLEQTTRILIPSKYISKIIGAGGCMIQEIAAKTKVSHIQIQSDKHKSSYRQQECVLVIKGGLHCQLEATILVLQQLDIFKNGGPVLISGKSMNANLVSQFKNSIQEQSKQAQSSKESAEKPQQTARQQFEMPKSQQIQKNGDEMEQEGSAKAARDGSREKSSYLNSSSNNNNANTSFNKSANNDSRNSSFNNGNSKSNSQSTSSTNNQSTTNNATQQKSTRDGDEDSMDKKPQQSRSRFDSRSRSNSPKLKRFNRNYSPNRSNSRDRKPNSSRKESQDGRYSDMMNRQQSDRSRTREQHRGTNERDSNNNSNNRHPISRFSSEINRDHQQQQQQHRSGDNSNYYSKERSRDSERFSPERDTRKKGPQLSTDSYQGKVCLLVPVRVAERIQETLLPNFKQISRCEELYFETDDSISKNFRKLIVKGRIEQNKLAFDLVQREIFFDENS